MIMEMDCRAVAAAVNGKIISAGAAEQLIRLLVIDSRQVEPGDFFIPLKGEHTDGHSFIGHAAERGAIGCFISRTDIDLPPRITAIAVPDTLTALQSLARAYRRRFSLPVVGITGSVGKTTTKDLLSAFLSVRYKTLKTEGNLNNEIGLPLMLSRLDSGVEAAVLEMGMSGPGEIDFLAEMAQPKIGAITYIAESHLEMLGSRENIARAKAELLKRLPEDGLAVINGDEPLLKPYLEELRCPAVTFGFSQDAEIRCTSVRTEKGKKVVCLQQKGYRPLSLVMPLPGRHNIYNLMAAVAAARFLQVTDREIREGLEQVRLSGMRLEKIIMPAGYNVINDSYNANPTSVAAALDVLADEAGRAGKIAVLGDMLELGSLEEEGHRQVGRLAAKHKLKGLVLIGRRAAWIAEAAVNSGMQRETVRICDSHEQAAQELAAMAASGDWVLIKGSRGMRLEKVLEILQEEDK